MRWPWRRHVNGEAKVAKAEADEQHKSAVDKTKDVDAAVRAAKEQAKRTNRFARDVELSWRLRQAP